MDYIQFNSRSGLTKYGRLEMTAETARIQIPVGALFAFLDNNNDPVGVTANYYRTVHSTGKFITMQQDRIYTPSDGTSRNIYLEPNGTGSIVAGDLAGTRYNMVASDFVKQSTRDSKSDINPLISKGMDVINRLSPVSY